ncbi:MAG: FAD-dependent oxidoreductase [Spirochaetes bacterium RBG_13_51_14]|nr:MAG: FAD-dependent oxidoreductase [Spirochaetes bacterium RBG_13_51_14]
MTYDCIIVGAGPAGIFTAMELLKHRPRARILIVEKGKRIENRACPMRETGWCHRCNPCNITTGFSGAGAFSDGKLILSPEIGGILNEYLPEEELEKLIRYVDDIYLSYGADRTLYGVDLEERAINAFRQKAIRSNLKFVESPVRHMGTEGSCRIYTRIQQELLAGGVDILFETEVRDLIIRDDAVAGVKTDKEYNADAVVLTVGREGAGWLNEMCSRYGIDTTTGSVDIGVRVEVRNEIMQEVNDTVYESKLIYYTPTFDDRVRTFCQNPAGYVTTEYYGENLAVVNGHSYKSDNLKTNNTNFAILVSNYFTDPFHEPIEYGKYIARLGNMLSGNKIIVQRFGDFRRGRRTTMPRLQRYAMHPTLNDAVPGDLSLVLPYRIMLDIKEMIDALDKIFPGLASDETLLYGVEVKFYSNIIRLNGRFETRYRGLYAGGDGAGVTRGLVQSSINGVLIGRAISGYQNS